MKTEIIKIDDVNNDKEKIQYASAIIKGGGLVAFPTETVYGLGANALDSKAVKKIFEAKGRPADNPLIAHVSGDEKRGDGSWKRGDGSFVSFLEQKRNERTVPSFPRTVPSFPNMMKMLTEGINEQSRKLMEYFWPGPLTIIFKKLHIVPYEVTAGLDTIAIRMPSNQTALMLIEMSGVPIVAPSANLSGKPSPTSAQHVIDDLFGRVDAIIDAGNTQVGIESTVINAMVNPAVILRPGIITKEDVMKVIGDVRCIEGESVAEKPMSPGMKHIHYSPKAKVVLVEGKKEAVANKIKEMYYFEVKNNRKAGILATKQTLHMYPKQCVENIGDREKPDTIASELFRKLREFDVKAVDIIFVEGIEDSGVGTAVMDRLRKAAGTDNIIKV